MKWIFLLISVLAFYGGQAQYLKEIHPNNGDTIEYRAGDKVFFKRKNSRTVQFGTIKTFRNDSIILNRDSFSADQLLHISPQIFLRKCVFVLFTGYELFGAFVQYGIGSTLYIALSTDYFMEDDPMEDALLITATFYAAGSLIRLYGRFLKNSLYALGKVKSFEIVTD